MSNGSEACCAIGVCCPPAERRIRLSTVMASELGIDTDIAGKVIDWFDNLVDMAPKGMLDLSKIADMIKKHG